MPIYEYECMKCGKIDEVIQKFSDNSLLNANTVQESLTSLFHIAASI